MAKKEKIEKTNAVRLLDNMAVDYELLSYTVEDGQIDGVSVATKIGFPTQVVYKTLVAKCTKNEVFVFVVPVAKELDLKKGAVAAGVKKIDLLPVKDLLATTGYIRGGCSPIGMKKKFQTFIDVSANELPYIIVSAGKIGMQLKVDFEQLVNATNAKVITLCNE